MGGRYFSEKEARWGLPGFDIRWKYHTVARLQVNLMDEHVVHFRDRELIDDIASRPGKGAELTSRHASNSEYKGADTVVRYRDYPKYCLGVSA